MKRFFTLFVIVCFTSVVAFAQRDISGTITDESGEPLIGANVFVNGTTIGTVTDFNGEFSLEVPDDATKLQISYTGYETIEADITDNMSVVLSEGITLEEAVVTALGVSREKKALGYAVQELKGGAVSDAPETNFVQSLSGKVSGVNIKQPNTMGGSANVVIRGVSSLTGNNQALFVVNGVPIDNSRVNATLTDGVNNQSTNRGGYDYGNAAMDINPEDIESISVLKGAAATALYGSRASNGVISITTKKGSRNKHGIGVTVSSGYTFSKINEETLPKHQREYGGGYGPFYEDETGYFYETDFDGDGTQDLIAPTSEDASWGAKFDPNLNVIHWDALDPAADNYGEKRPWIAGANDLRYFFETGTKWTNTVAIDGSNEKGSFRLAYTDLDESGILPNSTIDRNSVSFGGSYDITDRLNASFTGNYVLTEAVGRFGTGYDGKNVMQSFAQWIQTNVDFARLEEKWERADGSQLSWNSKYYDDLLPIFFDNPYWVRYKNFQDDNRDRIIGNVEMTYELTDWLKLTGRMALDNYSLGINDRTAVGSVDVSDFTHTERDLREVNMDLILTGSKRFNKFSLDFLLGGNTRDSRIEQTVTSTVGGLIVPNYYAVENSVSPRDINENLYLRNSKSGYGSVSIGYDSKVYLEFTDRYDQTSTLPDANNGYNYFSVSTSLILSELFNVGNNSALNFAKLRASYGEVGNDTDPYRVFTTYARDANQNANFGSAPLFSVPNSLQNENLLPERQKSVEAGLEMSWLDNRLSFDVAVYKQNTEDQIMPATVSSASGYSRRFVNGGEIENRGIELTANIVPVKTRDLEWNIGFNWTKNENKVISLYEGNRNLLLYSNWDVSINATVGEPYGTIRGTNFLYTNGKPTVGENGYYLYETDEEGNRVTDAVIGDVNPDWNMGIGTGLRYKNISISALVDIQKGGDIYSVNTKYGQATGVYAETAGLNDRGNPKRDLVADGGGVRFDAVKEDGTPNDIYVEAFRWARAFYYGNSPTARYVFDASYAKLREVVITYSLPSKLFATLPINGVNVSLVGRNLAILNKNVEHFDPEASAGSGNAQGVESGTYPTTRSYGINMRVRF